MGGVSLGVLEFVIALTRIMAEYVLRYFDWRARAETSRMLFALAGVEFEDVRISAEDWPAAKNGQ